FLCLTFFNKFHKFFSSFPIFLLRQIYSGCSEVKGEKKVLDFNEVKMFMENMEFFGSSVSEKLDSCYFLGFKQGSEFEKCQKIIKNFDENQDERIESLNLLILLFKGNHFC
ncbi:uncharacterized protein, partial [Medicago truncatula]|uniref:uncharacterized protein n=1 Tax=Medicago truncatula TaxID=3880 RepID=UPI001967B8DD